MFVRLFLFLCLPFLLYARKAVHTELVDSGVQGPWFTGPLLAPSGLVLPYPHIDFEPYFSTVVNLGEYKDNWKSQNSSKNYYSSSLQPIAQFGLTSWMDFEITPQLFYNYTKGAGKWVFGDINLTLNIQLYNNKEVSSRIPHIKLVLTEILPTGKYHKLNPEKEGTDIGGNGSFTTGVGVVFGQMFHLSGIHYMTTRLFLQYNLPAATRLKGYNVYGGGVGTDVKFFPSQNGLVDLAFEFTLAKHWVFATDFVAVIAEGSNFSGDPGTEVDLITPAALGNGKVSIQLSMAPAIEYNFNLNFGMIAGSWFTLAGRNAVKFAGGIVALNYYY